MLAELRLPPHPITFRSMRATDIPNFEKLTDAERVALADELLTSVRQPELLPPPIAHQLELERRWAAFEKDPSRALTKEQFWAAVGWNPE
jgi:putative addiction module component (TIGR02574 family)